MPTTLRPGSERPVPIEQEAGLVSELIRTLSREKSLSPQEFEPQTVQPIAQSVYQLCCCGCSVTFIIITLLFSTFIVMYLFDSHVYDKKGQLTVQ
jgi:hypothetical protein